jgi:transcription factor SPN1
MKRQLKALIEQWSRPIFAKSGNMRDLDRVQRGSGLSMGGNPAAASTQSSKQRTRSEQQQDLQDLIRSGKKSKTELTSSRVQVPYSRGFAYSVRPESRATMPSPQKSAAAASDDTRGKLSKRMTEKGRAISKNQRSANISIEGRVTKG